MQPIHFTVFKMKADVERAWIVRPDWRHGEPVVNRFATWAEAMAFVDLYLWYAGRRMVL